MYAELQGRVYSGHAEYDQLRGNLVARHEVTGITRDGYKVRHTVEVIEFGKPPRMVADPDAQMQADDSMIAEEGEHARMAAVLGVAARRRAEMDAALYEHMRANGPAPITELAELVRWKKQTLRNHLRDNPDYVCYQDVPLVYGLPGQEWTGSARQKPNVRHRARVLLQEHGPLTTGDLARMLDVPTGNLGTELRRNPEVFVKVGTTRAPNGLTTIVWDLAENGHGND